MDSALRLMLLVAFLASCSSSKASDGAPPNNVVSDERLNELERNSAAAMAALEASQARLRAIDEGMALLTAHQAQDPARVQRLIRQCQARTGARMEGEGAMRITQCVNDAW